MRTTLVIFGITGDLANRKLLPALSAIIEAEDMGELTIIGVSRRHVEQFQLLGEHHEKLSGTTSLFTMDSQVPEDYHRLRTYIDQQPDEQVLFYLSVPPSAVSAIVENLGRAGLNGPNNKLLLEKPFGINLASAHDMIDHTTSHFDESQIYRIDHFLAKEMAQNIVTFRARNAIFSHLWNNQFIERIEVVALETISIEGRIAFYEQTGALRDMVQGHLMQLLALTLLSVPDDLNWDDLPALRLAALRSLQPVDPSRALRAQYEGYKDEVNNHDSSMETFVSLELRSDEPAWEGVTFALTTGKALAKDKIEIRVHFKRKHAAQSNYLVFRIQPDEGIAIDLLTKTPGHEQDVEHHKLTYVYPDNTRLPDAYERVLTDAIFSRKSLFATSQEVLRAWEILAPLQKEWQTQTFIDTYPQGSKAADVIAKVTEGQSNQQQ